LMDETRLTSPISNAHVSAVIGPCACLCHESGGELEQIQFLLGHVSVQTTEKYLGCKQRSAEQ
jgi:integrase